MQEIATKILGTKGEMFLSVEIETKDFASAIGNKTADSSGSCRTFEYLEGMQVPCAPGIFQKR